MGTPDDKFKFNDMTERVDDLGLNLDMTDFRSYDPVLGRFHQVDMLAEMAYDFNPYQYAYDSPMYFNDPSGLEPEDIESDNSGGRGGGGGKKQIQRPNKEPNFILPKSQSESTGIANRRPTDDSWNYSNSINRSRAYNLDFEREANEKYRKSREGARFSWSHKDANGKWDDTEPGIEENNIIFDVASVGAGKLFKASLGLLLRKGESNLWRVGAYNEIRGLETGLHAHHVGQKSVMKQFITNYDLNTAPSILVPEVGHTIRGASGIVSRSTTGFTNARQVLARDIFELRRVYTSQGIPNTSLKALIELNKTMYPGAFIK